MSTLFIYLLPLVLFMASTYNCEDDSLHCKSPFNEDPPFPSIPSSFPRDTQIHVCMFIYMYTVCAYEYTNKSHGKNPNILKGTWTLDMHFIIKDSVVLVGDFCDFFWAVKVFPRLLKSLYTHISSYECHGTFNDIISLPKALLKKSSHRYRQHK